MNNQSKKIIVVLLVLAFGILGYFTFTMKDSIAPQSSSSDENQTPVTLQNQKSGIMGTVTGHYCNGAQPAEPPVGYEPCGNEMLSSFTLKIVNNTSRAEKNVTTDSSGKFRIELPPGKYTITQANKNPGIMGGPSTVDVKYGIFTNIQLTFQELRP